jgi:hypothetical protein
MKIGVFGDSYAEKRQNESSIWWGIFNQKILAEEIGKQLKPGIFQSSYSKFSNPVEPVENLFKKT